MGEEILARAVVFVVMVAAGGLILWTAKATADGRLGRNPVAGIRLPVTMASESAWIAAHRAARTPTMAAGWCAIVSAIPSVLPVPLPFAVGSVLAGAIAMLVLVLRGAAMGTHAARTAEPNRSTGQDA